MSVDEHAGHDVPDDDSGERTVGQELASGRPATTPFTLLASVVGIVAVAVTIVLAIVVVVVLLV